MSAPRPPLARAAVGLVLSGAAALVCQVLWGRWLGLLFGTTARAATAVVAATMVGMALGSAAYGWLPPRWRRRPFLLYGVLQAVIGLYGAAAPWLLPAARAVATAEVLPWSPFCVTAAFCLVPTAAMGLTLPALLAAFEGRRGTVGLLYGANCAGAVLGCLAAGFALIPGLGLTGTALVGAALNAMAVLAVLGEDRFESAAAEPPSDSASGSLPTFLAALSIVVGACAMAEEMLFVRLLTLLMGSTTYAFSLMLAVYLTGLAVGSWAAVRVERRTGRPGAWYGAATLAVGLALLGSLAFAVELQTWHVGRTASYHASAWQPLALQALLAALVMLAPAVAHGFLTPLAVRLWGEQSGLPAAGAAAGFAAFATAGNVAGTLVGGFGLGAWFQLEGGLRLAGATLVACGALALLTFAEAAPRARALAAGLALAAGAATWFAVPPWDLKLLHAGLHAYGDLFPDDAACRAWLGKQRLVHATDGPFASVAVLDGATGVRFLRINGKTDASSSREDARAQAWIMHLPLLLHPSPRRVLLVGLGAGYSLTEALRYPAVERLTCVEICPSVAQAAQDWFPEGAGGACQDPRVRLVVDDGRHFLARTDETYDVIASEPTNLWIAGVGNLFTREYYAECERRLAPGGLLCQWIQGYRLATEDLTSILRALGAVFPRSTLWVLGADFYVVARRDDAPFDHAALRARWASVVRPLLSGQPFLDLRLLELGYLGDLADLGRSYGPGPTNTDDTPVLEFSAPWSGGVGKAERILPWREDAIVRSPVPFTGLDRRAPDGGYEATALGVALDPLPPHLAALTATLRARFVKDHVPSVFGPPCVGTVPQTLGLVEGTAPGLTFTLVACRVTDEEGLVLRATWFPDDVLAEGEGPVAGHPGLWEEQDVPGGGRRLVVQWTCPESGWTAVAAVAMAEGGSSWRQPADEVVRRLRCTHGR